MQFLYVEAENNPKLCSSRLVENIADYTNLDGIFASPFRWASVEKISPSSWWRALAPKCDLKELGAKFISLPPTSACVERSFSKRAFYQSKQRNRLTNDRTEKLVFISQNYHILNIKGDTCAPKHLEFEEFRANNENTSQDAAISHGFENETDDAGSDIASTSDESQESLNLHLSLRDLVTSIEVDSIFDV